ncbi:ParB N-terminal domain-containing protein [Blautia sp.]|uniref:ParB N-terminal domain-containing protein n=1 Tax=Blautia sp. TaxID=1955243 RepID=UPI003AB186FF
MISNFPGHPFKVRDDKEMQDLADSVRDFGVLVPALVRPKGDDYEMVAGHRRKSAVAAHFLDSFLRAEVFQYFIRMSFIHIYGMLRLHHLHADY